jgi:DNA-binding GntR family transcriptional regulator
VSEKIDGLEVFDAERHAGRILGMGDILALVEQVTANVDMAAAQKLAAKVKSGDGFDLQDFLEQIRQMKNMGGLSSLMDKLPSQLAGKATGADMDRAEKVVVLKRIFRIGLTVAGYATSHLPHRFVPGLDEDFVSGESLYLTLLERYGLSPQRSWSRASLELPRDPIAEILQMEGKPPTWLLEGAVHNRHDPSQILEYNRSWLRVDLINVVYEMGPAPEFAR